MANLTNTANATEKKKPVRHTSPKAEALYAHLVTVDYGTKEYPDEVGSYNITLRMSASEAERFRANLSTEIEEAHAFMDEQFSKLKPATRAKFASGPTFNSLGTDEYTKETEELTGNVLFRFKTKAVYTDRQGRTRQRIVPIFDSMNQAVKLKDEVGSGSIVRISFTAIPYFVDGQAMGGLTLYLDAVQIIKLNKYGERSASDYGFSEEEGGFSSADMCDDDTDNDTDEQTTGNGSRRAKANEDMAADDVPF